MWKVVCGDESKRVNGEEENNVPGHVVVPRHAVFASVVGGNSLGDLISNLSTRDTATQMESLTQNPQSPPLQACQKEHTHFARA